MRDALLMWAYALGAIAGWECIKWLERRARRRKGNYQNRRASDQQWPHGPELPE